MVKAFCNIYSNYKTTIVISGINCVEKNDKCQVAKFIIIFLKLVFQSKEKDIDLINEIDTLNWFWILKIEVYKCIFQVITNLT